MRAAYLGITSGGRWVPVFTVDTFAREVFAGNPAGVCVLGGKTRPGGLTALDDQAMRHIARELNLSETAFVAPLEGGVPGQWSLRWFTPTCEAELCGHAMMGAAKCLYDTGEVERGSRILFSTRASGVITVEQGEDEDGGELLAMDFPADPPQGSVGAGALGGSTVLEGLGLKPEDVLWSGRTRLDMFLELQPEAFWERLAPNFGLLAQTETRGVVVTARTFRRRVPQLDLDDVGPIDFVSRWFGPRVGLTEDPVTGSAHCALGPYWADKRGESDVVGYQASSRGGMVFVHCVEDRVRLRGYAVLAMEGTMRLPQE